MTIHLDDRVGSGDLATYFTRWKTPFKLCRLDYGDAAWEGNGPDGPGTMPIGVEIKKVRDALNCMTDGRFAGHQLPGLIEAYKRVWMVVEGPYGTDMDSGMLLQRRGKVLQPITCGSRKFMFRDLAHWLTTLEMRGGVRVARTYSRLETARFIQCLYGWWCNKEFADHRAHLAFDESDVDGAILFRPTTTQRIAAQLPGVGFTKSRAVARRFKSTAEMVCATEADWCEVDGIGKGLAKKIMVALEGGTQ